MSGDYTPIDHDLPQKPEFLAIMGMTGATAEQVFYRLFLLWRMSDRQTLDGKLMGMTPQALSAGLGGTRDFWLSVESVGWLRFTDDGAEIPDFETHFSRCAKRRIEDCRRKNATRRIAKVAKGGQSADRVRTECGQNASQEPEPCSCTNVQELPPSPFSLLALMALWNTLADVRKAERSNKARATAFKARWTDDYFRKHYRAAIAKFPLKCFATEPDGWKPTLDWFLRPNTVQGILEGKYDWCKGTKNPTLEIKEDPLPDLTTYAAAKK